MCCENAGIMEWDYTETLDQERKRWIQSENIGSVIETLDPELKRWIQCYNFGSGVKTLDPELKLWIRS